MNKEIEQLEIRHIKRDAGTQCRLQLSTETVERYRQLWIEGAPFPPVIIFYDGNSHYLADGFHRTAAAEAAELKQIPADVRPGTRRDAVLYAVGANADHGLPRSNEDKRRAVDLLLRDPEWCRKSNGWIAKHAKVSKPFVAKRRDLVGAHVEEVQGRDGKTHTVGDADQGAGHEGEEGSWDPWGGRTGKEAKAFLATVDDWRLCELLAEKPAKGCKSQAETQYVTLRKIATARSSDLVYMVEAGEPGEVKERPAWWWSAVLNRFASLVAELEPVEDVTKAAAKVASLSDLERLCQRRLHQESDQDRNMRRVLLEWRGMTSHYTFRWNSSDGEVKLADVVRAQFPAWAQRLDDERLAKQERDQREEAEHEEEVQQQAEARRRVREALMQRDEDHTLGYVPELPEDLRDWLWGRARSSDEPIEFRAKAAAALRPTFFDRVSDCRDPGCVKEGGFVHTVYAWSECWRCARSLKRAQQEVSFVRERAAELARAGVELPGLQLVEPRQVETLPPDPGAVGCPICLEREVGVQVTVDRGEVLQEHDLPFASEGRCPGSFLPPAVADRVMRDLDDCAPQLIRLLTLLARSAGAMDFPWRELQACSPRLDAELRAWLDDKAPGAARVPSKPPASSAKPQGEETAA